MRVEVRFPLSFTAVWLLLVVPTPTQELVKEIHPGFESSNRSSWPQHFVQLGGLTYLISSGHGSDDLTVLWCTDGTAAGTRVVRTFSYQVVDMEVAAGHLFALVDAPGRMELWAGTGTLTDLTVISTFVYVEWMKVESAPGGGGDRLWMGAQTVTEGRELWTSDGTAAGTSLFADIWPGPQSSRPSPVASDGDGIWFGANDGVEGYEPVHAVGTGWTVVPVRPGPESSHPGWDLHRAASGVYFAADDGVHGRELYRASTTGLTRIEVQPGPMGSDPMWLSAVGSDLYFSADDGTFGRELWRARGTVLELVADLAPGTASSFPGVAVGAGRLVWFAGENSTVGRELFQSSGTPGSTRLVADLAPGAASSWPEPHVGLGDSILFSARGLANGLWSATATTPPVHLGAARLSTYSRLLERTKLRPLAVQGDRVLFGGVPASFEEELWMSDGTPAGTVQLRDLHPPDPNSSSVAASVGGAAVMGDRLFFYARDGTHGQELWTSDGTAGGTRLLADLWPGPASGVPLELSPVDDQLFFTALSPATGRELWVTDGAEVRQVIDLQPGPGSGEGWFMTAARGKLLFAANDGVTGFEPWVSDGTAAGTRRLADTHPSGSGISVGSRGIGFAELGGEFYFLADVGSSWELWRTDTTPAGTSRVVSIPSSAFLLDSLVESGGLLYFVAYTAAEGSELWVSDGTAAGTGLACDIWPGPESSFPDRLTPWSGRLLFVANDGATGRELWISDGTWPGTRLLADIAPGALGSRPFELTPAGVEVFFSAWAPSTGRELYLLDGAGGVAMVADVAPGPARGLRAPINLSSTHIGASGSAPRVLFAGIDASGDEELWASDGTAGGTRKLADLAVGPWDGAPRGFWRVDRTLLFTASTPDSGTELWSIDVVDAGGTLVESFGEGSIHGLGGQATACALGFPTLGNESFVVKLRGAVPNAPAELRLSMTPATTLLGPPPCTLYVAAPWHVRGAVTDGAGNASIPLPVPASTAFIGRDVYAQWLFDDPGGCYEGRSLSNALRLLINR